MLNKQAYNLLQSRPGYSIYWHPKIQNHDGSDS